MSSDKNVGDGGHCAVSCGEVNGYCCVRAVKSMILNVGICPM
jgi:hypothetical protein